MRSNPQFEALQARLSGQTVTDRQLAGNSLSISVSAGAGASPRYTIWLEPTWHLVGPGGVLAGSRQAQDEEEPSGWAAVTVALDALLGRIIEALELDVLTGDLSVILSGGLIARTFVTDPRDRDLWVIRDLSTDQRLEGGAKATIVDRDA